MEELKKPGKISDEELMNMDRSKLIEFYRNQEKYCDNLEDNVKHIKNDYEKRLKESR